MMKLLQKLILYYCIILCIPETVLGQDAAIFSQFTLNPYQFNPSFAAQKGYSEANIFYRKQWLGIENAPEVGAFNIQTPVGRNVSLGFNVYSNKTILLNTTAALATFAYRVRLGYYHHLNFGISGGAAMNNFDLNAVSDTNDPALANVVQKSTYVSSQFGINYQIKNFNIGFALPNVLDSKPNSLKEFQEVKFSPFRNKFGSASYNFNLGDVQLSPTVIYRALDTRQDQWEGMLIATYKGFLWMGASYRDGYGITGFIGVKLKGLYRVGYAYEHPTSSISKASSGSHEIYFGARLGKRDREEQFVLDKKKSDSLAQVALASKELERQKQELAEAEQKKPVVQEEAVAVVVPPVITEEPTLPKTEDKPVVEEKPVVIAEEKPKEEPPADYYVVLGAYRNQQNALKQMRDLRDRSMLPQMLYDLEKNYYYVYIHKSNNREDALAELVKERERNRFAGVWIYKAPKK
jgi:type IX secretion system PorP/SprF family membrane protein